MSGIFSVGGAGAVGVSGFYPVQINDSLRFEDGSSAYLNRTPSSAGNRRTWTWSGWFKRGNLSAVEQDLFSAGNSSTDRFEVILSAAYPNQLQIYMNTGGTIGSLVTSQVFRDVSAWYHLVIAFDTTQATASNRVKIYVNGSQVTDFQIATYPSQNFNTAVNSTSGQFFSRRNYVADRYYDGYMADAYMIDGQALDPTSFGEAKDGTWIPKSYSGSYGTNGFHLEFNGNSNDTSGNGNNWTANNISAHDYVPDSPTNNFAVMNVLSKDDTSVVYSEGNLQAINSTSTSRRTYSTIAVKSGKWYFEYYVNAIGSSTTNAFGVQQATDVWADGLRAYRANGDYFNGTGWASYGATFTTGDIISFAVDYDSDTIEFFKNNVSQGQKTSVGFDTSYDYVALINLVSSFKATANFGQDSTFAGGTTAGGNADGNGVGDFKYSVPSGYLALCTSNFPEPTIIDGSEYFNTVLYTGNNSTQSITGVGFSPAWVWLKSRTSVYDHTVYDVIRGATYKLPTNDTYPESADTDTLTSFDTDGFSVGDDVKVNAASGAMVSWNWKAGTAFSNSAGTNGATIASSGSVNADAGFSIVSYTGTGSNGTVAHGLSATPSMIIVRVRSTTNNWAVYHSSLGNTKALLLDTTNSGLTSSLFWNNTTPTSSVFSISTGNSVNNSGQTYIAYCFANIDGYSKVGSYTGNGSSDGTFVYTGFRPAWIMFKGSTVSSHWLMFDVTRHPSNVNDSRLFANLANAEDSAYSLDLLSNGFKLRHTGSDFNSGGNTYTYLAFAENPFKYANAR